MHVLAIENLPASSALPSAMTSEQQRRVLITGVLGGIGRATAAAFRADGWWVDRHRPHRARPMSPPTTRSRSTSRNPTRRPLIDQIERRPPRRPRQQRRLPGQPVRRRHPRRRLGRGDDDQPARPVPADPRPRAPARRGARRNRQRQFGARDHDIGQRRRLRHLQGRPGRPDAEHRHRPRAARGALQRGAPRRDSDVDAVRRSAPRPHSAAAGQPRGPRGAHPARFVAQPEAVAPTIVHLVDRERSPYTTGQSIVIDGGASVRLSTE